MYLCHNILNHLTMMICNDTAIFSCCYQIAIQFVTYFFQLNGNIHNLLISRTLLRNTCTLCLISIRISQQLMNPCSDRPSPQIKSQIFCLLIYPFTMFQPLIFSSHDKPVSGTGHIVGEEPWRAYSLLMYVCVCLCFLLQCFQYISGQPGILLSFYTCDRHALFYIW